MPNTTVAWGSFPTRKAADRAVSRLVSSGFARNSIDLRGMTTTRGTISPCIPARRIWGGWNG